MLDLKRSDYSIRKQQITARLSSGTTRWLYPSFLHQSEPELCVASDRVAFRLFTNSDVFAIEQLATGKDLFIASSRSVYPSSLNVGRWLNVEFIRKNSSVASALSP